MGPLHHDSGSGRDERPHLDDDAVVEALRRTVPQAPPADVREQHLAAIAQAAAAAGHEVPDTVPAGWAQRWGTRARRVVALTAVKVGLSGAAVALAAGGGLAATGNLPDPAQRVVADVAERAGVTLPRPDADRTARSEDGDGTPQRPVTPEDERPGPADERPEHTPPSDRVQDPDRSDRPTDPASRRPADGGPGQGEDPPASDRAPAEPGAPDHAEDDRASDEGDNRDERGQRDDSSSSSPRRSPDDSSGQQSPPDESTPPPNDRPTERSQTAPSTEPASADGSGHDAGSSQGLDPAGEPAPAPTDQQPDVVTP